MKFKKRVLHKKGAVIRQNFKTKNFVQTSNRC